MSTKAYESVIEEWETYEGVTSAWSYDGAEVIIISARVNETMWERGTNVRSWTVFDTGNNIIAEGEANGLRLAKKEALAALEANIEVYK